MRAALPFMSGAGAVLLVAVAGCSNQSPPSSPAAAAPADAPGEAEAEDLPELLPVPVPENLVALATLRTPARTLDTALAWTGMGIDFRTVIQAGPAAALLPVLDLDAPLDVVVSLDPKSKTRPRALFAASVGLTSRQGALDALQSMELPVEFVEPGVHSVRVTPELSCFVSPALGKAKARLTCSEDRESLDALAPYLTRGTPSEGTGDADLHAELRAEAPWRLFGEKTQLLQLGVPMLLGEVSIGNPEFDGALRDGATALVDELILSLGELKDLKLDAYLRSDANVAANNELEANLSVAFNAARSWLARALADGETRASAAPDTFWKLPVDSVQAAYYAVGNPNLTQSAVDVMDRLFESGLGHLGASPALQRAWPAAFKQAMDVKGPMVSARGEIPKEALAKQVDEHEEMRSSFGYTILGIEDPDSRFPALLEQTLKLYEDSALRKSLTAKYGLDAAKLPKAQSKKGPARLKESRSYEIALPAALIVEAVEDKPGNAKELAPIPIVILSCRDGRYSWFGFSSYGSVLEQKLAAVISGGGPESTLAARPGIERLKTERANAAGFWTLGALSRPSFVKSELDQLLAPFAGNNVPILGSATGHAAGPSGLMQAHVPAQLFRDIALAVATHK